jgi:hypothetical protein
MKGKVTFARGQNTRMGGSDPDFGGFQPPNTSWGRSRPSRSLRDRVLCPPSAEMRVS